MRCYPTLQPGERDPAAATLEMVDCCGNHLSYFTVPVAFDPVTFEPCPISTELAPSTARVLQEMGAQPHRCPQCGDQSFSIRFSYWLYEPQPQEP